MRLAHLALLFFAISLPMYFMGYTSPLGQLIAKQGTQPLDFMVILEDMASKMINLNYAVSVFGLALGIIALTGFAAVYVIPALILSVTFNYVLIPSSFLLAGQCGGNACLPPEVSTVLTVFLNLIVFMAFVEFITGR